MKFWKNKKTLSLSQENTNHIGEFFPGNGRLKNWTDLKQNMI